MIGIYIIISALLTIFLLLAFSVKVVIKYKGNSNCKKEVENITNISCIEVYIFEIIKVKRIIFKEKKELKKSDKSNIIANIIDAIFSYVQNIILYIRSNKYLFTKKKLKRINNSIYIKKINANIGINLSDCILNAYVLTLFNTVINMYLSINEKNINLNDVYYNIQISKKILDLNLDITVKIHIIKIIDLIFKVVFKGLIIKITQNKSQNNIKDGFKYNT